MMSKLEKLREECEKCEKCELCKSRTNLVFGTGNENAKVMFIGEAPGESEDLQGEPFVGRSGKLLDSMLEEIGLDRKENIFIANMLKCRPPKNRDPLPKEQDLCINWLYEQIRIINPKVVVCLGRISSQRMIGKDFKVTTEHGQFIEKDGIVFMGTFHPAALLRNPHNKPLAKEDFEKLKEKIK